MESAVPSTSKQSYCYERGNHAVRCLPVLRKAGPGRSLVCLLWPRLFALSGSVRYRLYVALSFLLHYTSPLIEPMNLAIARCRYHHRSIYFTIVFVPRCLVLTRSTAALSPPNFKHGGHAGVYRDTRRPPASDQLQMESPILSATVLHLPLTTSLHRPLTRTSPNPTSGHQRTCGTKLWPHKRNAMPPNPAGPSHNGASSNR
jgi:hypothetical protein